MRKIKAIDFFCGAGGLTKGLNLAGINVFAGVDYDLSCKNTYESNNNAYFINKGIQNITTKEVKKLFKENTEKDDLTMIAGCAPCQPYSLINTRKKKKDIRKTLLSEFARVINGVKPHFVLMENVSSINKDNKFFSDFIDMLERNQYEYKYEVLNAKNFGVAQSRKRLFLIASRLKRFNVAFDNIREQKPVVLRDIIYNLQKIEHDMPSDIDNLHRARKLNTINLKRIKATKKNGGLRNSWSEDLKLPCHKKKESFLDNYGRLSWDKLSATITTKFNQYYSGRFGHPEQDRALSLREGALIQTFPPNYEFYGTDMQIARQIGNAVPVNLSRAVGEIFVSTTAL